VFTNFFRNYYFLVIFAIMVGGQVLIVMIGGAAFQVVRIGGRDWVRIVPSSSPPGL
jgi:Ca2+-transporting ATPase